MEAPIDLEEDREDILKKKVFKPRIIHGGLTGGEPPTKSDAWILELEIGTIFLVYNKLDPYDYLMPQFLLVEITDDKNVRLLTQGTSEMIDVHVHPQRFCKKYGLGEIRGIRSFKDVEE